MSNSFWFRYKGGSTYREDKWDLTAPGRSFYRWKATRTRGSTVENVEFVGVDEFSGM
ncbi:hypothetical protein IMF22_10015 [Pseudomonas poae]|uniref:Uncharacterized protein n=1 Tax=Pseudomonas poae TaxID=200451 RepID=A0A7M1KM13_9PSED|nr:hypothetical protein [Pseudomonas poae]QOQ77337.1 hypothetical protein IMF22_10015 [Pseudomonas poae]